MSFSAQAQTTNICDRTPQVVAEILRLTSTADDECDSVSVSEMADIFGLTLLGKGITSLQSEDFAGLSNMSSLVLQNNNDLTELPEGIFSGLSSLTALLLANNSLETLPPNLFPDAPNLNVVILTGNPGAPFRLTVRFEPETLEEDFDAAPVRLFLREGAPTTVTVPLSVTGGDLIAGSPDSLVLSPGSIRSVSVTVIRGEGYFRLTQGNPELGVIQEEGADQHILNYQGLEIVRGPAITVGGIRVRARVFLEGALE